MGIRIHKSLGWVYTGDLKIDYETKTTLEDLVNENKDNMMLSFDLGFAEDRGFLKRKMFEFIEHVDSETKRKPEDSVFLFRPPHREKWSRYNDSIDFLEKKDGKLEIKYLGVEIFPYRDPFVVSKTGRELTDDEYRFVSMTAPFTAADQIRKVLSFDKIKDQLIQMGLDPAIDRREQIHQTPPEIVKIISKHFGVDDYKVLRPAIVSYWR